jgi:hypothetical protein
MKNENKLIKEVNKCICKKGVRKDECHGYLINRRVVVCVVLGTVKSNWMISQMKLPFRAPRVVLRRGEGSRS